MLLILSLSNSNLLYCHEYIGESPTIHVYDKLPVCPLHFSYCTSYRYCVHDVRSRSDVIMMIVFIFWLGYWSHESCRYFLTSEESTPYTDCVDHRDFSHQSANCSGVSRLLIHSTGISSFFSASFQSGWSSMSSMSHTSTHSLSEYPNATNFLGVMYNTNHQLNVVFIFHSCLCPRSLSTW